MYRLTVHLTKQKKYQNKLFNTITYKNLSEDDLQKKLSDIRSKYTIAKGKNPKKKHKFDKELIHIRHEI